MTDTEKIATFDGLEEGEWYHYDHERVPDPEEITFRFKDLDSDEITQGYKDGFEVTKRREGVEELLVEPGVVKGEA